MRRALLLLVAAITVWMTACGGGFPAIGHVSNPGSGPGSTAAITVTITPGSVSLAAGAEQTFSTTVTDTMNTSVTWSVVEGAAGGSITTAGVYTACLTSGTYHVRVTSVADPSKYATAVVTVTATASPITVSISPGSTTDIEGGIQSFSDSVTGTSDTAVTWSVAEGASGGSISGSGVYIAPLTPGTYHVTATSRADPTRSATAAVTVFPPAGISLGIDPDPAMVFASTASTVQFSVWVTGTANRAVIWSVIEPLGGSISVTGVYTAPTTPGLYHLRAISQADPSQSAIATVSVLSSPLVARIETNPFVLDAVPNSSYSFSAEAVDGDLNIIYGVPITWAISEGSAGGTFDPVRQIYTAPSTPGTYHIVAADGLNPGIYATVDVTVHSVEVFVSPHSDVLGRGTQRRFVGNSYSGPVDWSVSEGASGGSIVPETGTPFVADYTAADTVGTYHVVARSTTNPANSDTATITVVPSGFHSTILIPTVNDFTTSMLTATRLSDGRVLVAGGMETGFDWCCGSFYPLGGTSRAVLFDPVAGTFSAPAVTMSLPRFAHTATLLNNGMVLITGGFSGGDQSGCEVPEDPCYATATNTAEIYDPATGNFTPAGAMAQARAGHTATLLANGKVLITGGATGFTLRALGLPFGGTGATAEIYDPDSGLFTLTGAMGTARYDHTATLLANGKVLIAGGFADATTAIQTAELYDPAAGTFSATGDLNSARGAHTAALLLASGNVLLAGGTATDGGSWGSSLGPVLPGEVYDVFSGTFTATENMAFPHIAATAVTMGDGSVLIAGGFDGTSSQTYQAELYQPITNHFTQTGSMDHPRAQYAVTPLPDGSILFVGGSSETSTSATIYK